MKCPQCDHTTFVYETYKLKNACAVRRRRKCGGCKFKFTTYETPASTPNCQYHTHFIRDNTNELVVDVTKFTALRVYDSPASGGWVLEGLESDSKARKGYPWIYLKVYDCGREAKDSLSFLLEALNK